MAIRRCPYCKAIIDESQKYCNNCGTQLLFPEDEGEEPIKGEKIVDADFPESVDGRDSGDLIDEPRDEAEIDLEESEERREIDLEKVVEGKAEIEGDEPAEGQSFVDLREAEPPESLPEEPPIEKPATAGDFSGTDIKFPEQPEPEEAGTQKPGRSPSRPKKKPAEKPADEIAAPPVVPAKKAESPVKARPAWEFEAKKSSPGRKDHDTKFEIARLIADFERRRRNYTAELGTEAADARGGADGKAVEEPVEPPTEAEVGPPPSEEELRKEDEALRTEPTGDFATEYEFAEEKEVPEKEEPPATEDRLPFLVGSFKKAMGGGGARDEEAEPGTQHPVFSTGDLDEEPGPPVRTAPPAEPPVEKDLVIEKRRGDDRASAAPSPPAKAGEDKSALIAKILKSRAEAAAKPAGGPAASETWESLKTSKPSEPALFPPESGAEEKIEVEPEERPESPVGDTMDFQKEVLRRAEEPFPPLPTMGIPETVAPAADTELEKELEVLAPEEKPVVRRPEPPAEEPVPAREPVREPVRESREAEREAPRVEDIPREKPPVRAPVVRLGFFRRIKATIFDLLVVGVFWTVATALASVFLSVPVLDLIAVAAVPLGILFAVLLAVYLFLFLLFLGETPGGRLSMPRS